MEQPFYVDHLARHGIGCVIPDDAERAEVHRVIFDELCKGVVDAGSRERLRRIIGRQIDRGAEGVVLGCTELCADAFAARPRPAPVRYDRAPCPGGGGLRPRHRRGGDGGGSGTLPRVLVLTFGASSRKPLPRGTHEEHPPPVLGAPDCPGNVCPRGRCQVRGDRAPQKKLSGAARTSFIKKCEPDAATATCDAQAAEKKLAGAAKTSFTKKCVEDSAGKNSQPRPARRRPSRRSWPGRRDQLHEEVHRRA